MKPKPLNASRSARGSVCAATDFANTKASFQLEDHIADPRSKISHVHRSALKINNNITYLVDTVAGIEAPSKTLMQC